MLSLPPQCKDVGPWAFCRCRALIEADLEGVVVVDADAFHGCCRLCGLGSVKNLRRIGCSAFEAVAVEEIGLGIVRVQGSLASRSSSLVDFSGEIKLPSGTVFAMTHGVFDGCRHLKRLELTPSYVQSIRSGFVRGSISSELAGHVPERIRYHGDLREAGAAFDDLICGCGAAMVIITDEGEIRGGPGSAAPARDDPVRVWAKPCAPSGAGKLRVRIVDLLALPEASFKE
jgi:hypothetical protein